MAPAARFFIPEAISDEFCPFLITPPHPLFAVRWAGERRNARSRRDGAYQITLGGLYRGAGTCGERRRWIFCFCLASEIKNKVTGYFKSGFAVERGTRNQVLLLAELYPKPLRDAGNKFPDHIFNAYYSEEVLASRANADYLPELK
jgi:hypothetical protein